MEYKVEIVAITNNFALQFVHIPKGYKYKSSNFEESETRYLGKLNNFNRLKLIEHWKQDNTCLVESFTKVLEKKGWDFNKFPNPIAIIIYKNENN